MNDMDSFMENKGFPYRLDNMHQMFTMLRTRGSSDAVVVRMDEGHYYVGYYDHVSATNVAATARAIRKFKVTDVATFKGGVFE